MFFYNKLLITKSNVSTTVCTYHGELILKTDLHVMGKPSHRSEIHNVHSSPRLYMSLVFLYMNRHSFLDRYLKDFTIHLVGCLKLNIPEKIY